MGLVDKLFGDILNEYMEDNGYDPDSLNDAKDDMLQDDINDLKQEIFHDLTNGVDKSIIAKKLLRLEKVLNYREQHG